MSDNLQNKQSRWRRKGRKTFAFRMSIVSVAFALLCVGIISIFSFFSYRSSVINLFGEKAGSVAFSVAGGINPELFTASIENEMDDFWYYIQRNLDNMLSGISELTFLYIMMPYDNERFIYFASAGWPELHGVVEDPEIYGQEPWQAMQEGRITTTALQDAGEWGILISGFAPVFDAYGRAIAVVGADVDVTRVNIQTIQFMRNIAMIGLITAAAIGLLIWLFTTRTLNLSLRRIVGIDIASSDDTGSFKARESDKYAKDEISVLYLHFDEMLSTIHTLQTDISIMLNKHMSGHYEYRLDASKYAGNQQKLIEDLNALVNMYVTDFIELLEVSKQYGEGNFSANVSVYPENWRWANKIVNDLQAGFVRLTSEIDKLVGNAAQGNFDVQADVSGMQGEWAHIIGSLNKLLTSFAEPLADIEQNITSMSKGDFTRLEREYPGTFAVLKNACNLVNDTTAVYVDEISQALQSIANGDLTVEIKQKYIGSYAPIETALNTILENLNSTLFDVQSAVDQVTLGAGQISENAMNLADGASRQNSTIEELSDSVALIHEKAMQASNNAVSASEGAIRTKEHVTAGDEAVISMAGTMNKVKESSESIAKINDVITSIAFQTNLLALNASVEAARAGEHGKGFAVVAEEVRNLAGRSQTSASDTAELIEEDVRNVEEGLKTTENVVSSFETISASISEISGLISDIVELSGEQLKSISNINDSVSEISEIVTVVSSSAEESASASQELSSQAEMLRQKVKFFRLKAV